MTDESRRDQLATRRCVLLGAGVLGAAGVLTACSTAPVPYDANDAGQAPATAAGPTTASTGGGMANGAGNGASGGQMGTLLGAAAEVPVGGGQGFHRCQGRRHPARQGSVQGLQRRLHPRRVPVQPGRRRHHRLPLPRQQVQDLRRLGRHRPGHDPAGGGKRSRH